MSQGQGRATAFKERGFGSAFRVSMSLSNGKNVARFPYWHVDLNSGSGWNEQSRCDGSPLVFLQLAKEHRPNYRAFFCDKDEVAISRLAERVGKDAFCFRSDNSEMLPVVSAAIAKEERNPHFSVGTVVCDPNGYFGDAIPCKELEVFAERHERIDLIFNLNVRTYQMGRAHVQNAISSNAINGWSRKFWPSIADLPNHFPRNHWLVSEIRSPGQGDRFVIVIGRNVKTDGHKAMGHYRFDSVDGERLLEEFEGAAKRANPLETLRQLPGIPASSDLLGGETRRDDSSELAVRAVRRKSDRSSPQGLLPLGDV